MSITFFVSISNQQCTNWIQWYQWRVQVRVDTFLFPMHIRVQRRVRTIPHYVCWTNEYIIMCAPLVEHCHSTALLPCWNARIRIVSPRPYKHIHTVSNNFENVSRKQGRGESIVCICPICYIVHVVPSDSVPHPIVMAHVYIKYTNAHLDFEQYFDQCFIRVAIVLDEAHLRNIG